MNNRYMMYYYIMPRTHDHTLTFNKSYGLLNSAQQKAVNAIEGPVIVIAGPGTGKTTILTLRIANILLRTDIAPENILALTFTESGASSMRRKLLEVIGPSAYKVAIHTFHGFAQDIIERYPDYFPRIIGSRLIMEAEQIQLVEKIIQSNKIKTLRPFGDPLYYVSPVLREIHVLKRENISPDALRQSIEAGEIDQLSSRMEKEKHEKRILKNTELAYVYKEYEKALTKGKRYDFEDMLLELIRALEKNQEFKLILQEQYQYILADEHQDANASQNRILELLSDFHTSPNLFIVGDDKQAIYRFQGASLENFLYFKEKYPDALVVDLEHNYRSHQLILDASHSLISNNPTIQGRERLRLKSLTVGGNPIIVREFKTTTHELEAVAGSISDLIARGELPHEIAVLYRDNKHANALSACLEARHIPFRVESERDILGSPDVVKVIALCRAIHNLRDDTSLATALFIKELGAHPGEVAEACALSSRERLALYKVVERGSWPSVKQAYEKLIHWSDDGRSLPFPNFLQKLIQETGLMATIVGSPDLLERLGALQALYDHIARVAESAIVFRLPEFIDYLSVTETHGLSSREKETGGSRGIRLMTAHRAKGLEFNHVFLIHAADGIWGNKSARNLFHIPVVEHARAAGRVEDERRLVYVALTRARESVTISYALYDGNREFIPSQFIAEIDPALIRKEVIQTMQSPYSFLLPHSHIQGASTKSPLLEPAFIREKFLTQPLSVTHLNNFLECAWKYFFVNLIRVPQAENKHQLYGTAIHAALRTFFDAYKEERDMSGKDLVQLFRFEAGRLPFSASDRKEALEKGVKSLTGYYKEYYLKWGRRLLTEYTSKGAEIILTNGGRLELRGKLDKIEFLEGSNVVVIDYKTGKPKSRNHIEGKIGREENGEGNYFRQLAFYKLLLSGEGKFNMKYGEIDFIEPNERGKYKKERFEITPADVKKVKDEIVTMAEVLMSGSFVNSTCADKKCEYCRMGRLLSK